MYPNKGRLLRGSEVEAMGGGGGGPNYWLGLGRQESKVVVGVWGQGMGARGVVHGVEDKEVSDLPGNACA